MALLCSMCYQYHFVKGGIYNMIPKIIHYCWFGGGEIPDKDKKCIETWRKLCPDYEIIQWNEKNYDINKNRYMKDAYAAKKWGFVPDYARFDIVYTYGGIYLDTDVELIKPLDELLNEVAYMGFEDGNWVNGGIGFGAEKHNEIIGKLRDMYERLDFKKGDNTYNLTPSPHYITGFLEELGLVRNNKKQKIGNMSIYPKDYFAHKDYYTGKIIKTSHTVSIHHYNASWQSNHQRRMHVVRKVIGVKNYNFLVKIKNKLIGK